MSYELFVDGKRNHDAVQGFFEGTPLVARTVAEFREHLYKHGIPKRISYEYWLADWTNNYETAIHCTHELMWYISSLPSEQRFAPQWNIHSDYVRAKCEIDLCMQMIELKCGKPYLRSASVQQ